MTRLAVAGLALALFAALALLPTARADGDPASDYLLTRSTFVPPDLGIPAADAARLAQTVALARAAGYPIRVALIGSAYDLGSVASVYRRPKFYARFLGKELTLVYHGRLLVVMPNGYGVSRAGNALPASQQVLDRLPAPGTGGPQLAQAGIAGVRALAHAAGVRLAAPAPAAGAGGGSGALVWGLGAAAAALALAGLGFLALRRARRRGEPSRPA
jgi:hypothetical protein